MDRATALRLLREHRAEMDRFGVKSLAVFGSVARDEARPDSDVDMLVEFEHGATFDRYFGLLEFLEQLLGRRVDLVTRGSLKRAVQPYVEADLLDVA